MTLLFQKDRGEFTPIMNKLAEAEVVHLAPEEKEFNTGQVNIIEACDYHFACLLTKEEYIALAHEILKEAEKL